MSISEEMQQELHLFNPFKAKKKYWNPSTELVWVVLNIAVDAQILTDQEEAAKCDFAG